MIVGVFNMNGPFFSILIPVYNVEKYLAECLDSVLAQTFSDYEIILVDDGSTDSSGQICNDYRARYPDRIRVLHKENQGQISARSAGLGLAAGKYICFLDSDDYWVSNTLDRLHEILLAKGYDVVFFRWLRVNENGEPLSDTETGAFPCSMHLDKKTVFERILSTSILNSFCTKCCRRELFDPSEDFSRFYAIQNSEDLLQSLPVLYKANGFFYLNETLYRYRTNSSSITHVFRENQHRSLNVVRPLLYEYIEKMGLDSEANREVFFSTYLSTVWDSIEKAYTDLSTSSKRCTVFDEIRSYECVKKGKKYIGCCKLAFPMRFGLRLFYTNQNWLLNGYLWLYFPVMGALRRAKTALRRLLKSSAK